MKTRSPSTAAAEPVSGSEAECAPETARRTGSLLFLYDAILGASTVQVRGRAFREPLEAAGWNVGFVDVRSTPEREVLASAAEFDLVYLLKVASLRLVRQLRALRRPRLIFDLTDALWRPAYRVSGWWQLEPLLAAVDAVFSENEWVCAYGRRFNPTVCSIPACTMVERFDALRAVVQHEDGERLVVGWVGSRGTARALARIERPLGTVLERHPEAELRILGCDRSALPPRLQGARATFLPEYDEEAMLRELLRMDVGLYPPPHDLYDYCVRGALKGMLYMSAGIPAVCQKAGDCARIIQDGVNGMLASSAGEWEERLLRLAGSTELRREIGARALATIRAEHSVAHVSACFDRALREVLAQPARPEPAATEWVGAHLASLGGILVAAPAIAVRAAARLRRNLSGLAGRTRRAPKGDQ